MTGGRQPGDTVSEARAADAYLQERGVPATALRLEVDGRTSYESLAASARFLTREGIEEVILVSDGWHLGRSAEIARDVGRLADQWTEIESLAKDRDDEQSILDRNVYSRLAEMLNGKEAAAGPKGFKKGAKITAEALEDYPRSQWWQFAVSNEKGRPALYRGRDAEALAADMKAAFATIGIQLSFQPYQTPKAPTPAVTLNQ